MGEQNERRTPAEFIYPFPVKGRLPGDVPQADFQESNPEWISISELQLPICKMGDSESLPGQLSGAYGIGCVWKCPENGPNGPFGFACWFVGSSVCIEWLLCPKYWVGPGDTVVV